MGYICDKKPLRSIVCFLFCLTCLSLFAQMPARRLQAGMVISQSCTIDSGLYVLPAHGTKHQVDSVGMAGTPPIITIRGENLVIDFQHAMLRGAKPGEAPDHFVGLGIKVEGKNILIKNAVVRGYQIGLWGNHVEDLKLENCTFSYNYRPQLFSGRETEDFSDWLSYHHNDHDEWMRYGAGIYLSHCLNATVSACKVTGNQNALLLRACSGCLVFNNQFQFNSGLGIGLYRSSNNRFMHNRLDWNVRGYSHGFYQRGQDSAGILLFEQCNNNLIAYNSATHCGDGLFLWAGQYTMDTGLGGCNDNYLFGNDFSTAPANGVELTFSRNRVQGNLISDCNYGIWGGYSYNSVIHGNLISGCKTAIAIEHGQNDTIRQNYFRDDSTGIRLWANAVQDPNWGYPQYRDTRSRNSLIDHNVFLRVRKPLHISASESIAINGENLFFDFEKILENDPANSQLKFWRNDLFAPSDVLQTVWLNPELKNQRNLNFEHPDKTPQDPLAPLMIPLWQLKEPDSLPGGINTALQDQFPKPKAFIIMDKWGPYDFLRPIIQLLDTRPIANGAPAYQFRILGPEGRWELKKWIGFKPGAITTGQTPALLTLQRDTNQPFVHLEMVYSSKKAITSEWGEIIPPKQDFLISFDRTELKWNWITRFYSESDPEPRQPLATLYNKVLYYAWWNEPTTGVPADNFMDVSETEITVPDGLYQIFLSADEGVRLWIDGKLHIDHWAPHETETDTCIVKLGGKHRFEIHHFDRKGFANLDFRMQFLPK